MNTNLAAAMADTSKLDPFEGIDVLAAGIEIPGAAGGLRDAMRIEPQQFHAAEKLYVVLECDVAKIRFDPIQSDGETLGWRRVHVLAAQAATFVDGDLVKEAIESQKRKITLAAEAAAGIGRLAFADDDEAIKAHADGLHSAGLVPGCPTCDEEADAATVEEAGEAAVAVAEAPEDPHTAGTPASEAEDWETPPPAPTPLHGRKARAKKAAGG